MTKHRDIGGSGGIGGSAAVAAESHTKSVPCLNVDCVVIGVRHKPNK